MSPTSYFAEEETKPDFARQRALTARSVNPTHPCDSADLVMLNFAPANAVHSTDGDTGDAPRALLAEDNELCQQIVVKRLTQLGCRVDVARDGLEAVEYSRKNNYDLIIMDLRMPNMDGFTAAEHIRQRDRDLPIVALTAQASFDDQARCEQIGMNGFFTKPARLDTLKKILTQYVKRHH